MAKFYGPIGYAVTEETTPGVWEDRISERMYFGELVRNTRRLQTADKLNDNINVSNEISILHPFDHVHPIRVKQPCHRAFSNRIADVICPARRYQFRPTARKPIQHGI